MDTTTFHKHKKQSDAKIKELKRDIAATYNKYKKFEGQQYTGMTIGRSHSWHYDQGDWKEKKVAPDKWEFTYAVTKRRRGHAPEGSGVPVGTEYHWYILAHQVVRKLNANDYSTSMTGLKYKLAHKRFDHENWSAGDEGQRKRLIAILEEYLGQLKGQPGAEKTATPKPRRSRVQTVRRLPVSP
jgi:hypothetical protein